MPGPSLPPSPQNNMRGMIAMSFAMAFFVLNDALIKLARVHWETGQILVVRGVFVVGIVAILLLSSGQYRKLDLTLQPLVLLRGVLEGFIAGTFITALGMMALADITAINMLAPLTITALSTIFFGERVGWRRWLAVLTGFIGMLFVVQPNGAMPLTPVLLTLACMVAIAWRDLLTRQLPAGIPTHIVTLVSTLGVLITGGLLSWSGPAWRPLTPDLTLLMGSTAILVAAGNFAMIVACRGVDLSAISPFRYSIIAWALLLGIFVFGDWPTPLALVGLVLIAGSGLYTIHRERMLKKQAFRPGDAT